MLKISQYFFICFLSFAIFLFARNVNAATYTVCSSGCDSTGIQNVFDTINLQPDDIVEVRADSVGGTATFREAVTWGSDDGGSDGRPVILRGRSGDTIILHGDSNNDGTDDLVTLIDIPSVDYVEVQNLTLTHPTMDGLQVRGTSTGVVARNITATYSGNQNFQMEDTASATYYNIVGSEGVDDGFSMHGTTTAVIVGGTFNHNADGINIIDHANLTARDVVVSNCVTECIYVLGSLYSQTVSGNFSSTTIYTTGGSLAAPVILLDGAKALLGADAQLIIDHLIIKDMPSSGTSAALIQNKDGGNLEISNFEIVGNTSDAGVRAILNEASADLLNLSFGKISGFTDHFIDNYSVANINRLILNNIASAKFGISARASSQTVLRNSVINDGSDLNGKGVFVVDATASLSVYNSVLSELNVLLHSGGGSWSINNNILWGNTSANVGTWSSVNGVASNPYFVSTSTPSFNYLYTSPAIDAGTFTSLITSTSTDILGNPIYGTPDIGPYEYQPPFTVGASLVDTTGNIRIYQDGKFRYTTSTSSSMSADFSALPLGGATTYAASSTRPEWLNISNIVWDTSGSYSKSWTASSSVATTTVYTVGNMEPSRYYNVSVDGLSTTTLQANGSGQITYVYNGGYSSHSFSVSSDTMSPTAPILTSPLSGGSGSANQTFSWTASTDREDGILKYALYLDGTLNTDNIASTSLSITISNISCGSHTWSIRATDNAQNTTDSNTSNFTVPCSISSSGGGGNGLTFVSPAILASTTMSLPFCPKGYICTPKPALVVNKIFTKNLRLGMTDPDVKDLQVLLNSLNFTVADFGYGSSGQETDYFGQLTKNALVRYQKEKNIPGTGFFGPLTRASVNAR